jgi:RNA polymerase sigma-70 factor (ECF subfamily)
MGSNSSAGALMLGRNGHDAEQENFAECVAQYLPFLNRIVRKLTRSDQFADDMVQQTVLKAITNAHQFRFECALKTWLASIAVNEVRQIYRSNWRAVPLVTEDVHVHRYSLFGHQKDHYEAKERDVLVRDAVSRLPQIYRSVIELCDFQCLPFKQAARELGLTLSAVKSRRHRALKKLRPLVTELKPDG